MPPMTSIAAIMSIIWPFKLTRTSRGADRNNTGGSSELSSALLFCIGALPLAAVRSRQTSGILQRTPQQIFDLPVDAAELRRRPPLQRVVDLRIEPKGESLSFGHFFSSVSSLVQRPGVDDGLDAFLTAQHDKQIAHHRRLALFVERDDILATQLVERHLDHADGTFNDELTCGDNR